MTFETPELKFPQVIVTPPNTGVVTPLMANQEPTPPVPNFTEPTPSRTGYWLPICPRCWGNWTRWSYEQCVLLQNGDDR